MCLRNPEQGALWDPVHVEFNLYIFFKSGPPVKYGFNAHFTFVAAFQARHCKLIAVQKTY